MIKAGIIGGAGYTAGELIRLLINHPDVEIKWVNSSSNAGNRVDAVHQGLIGELGDVLWFVSGICNVLGLSLEDVAEANLAKLAERKKNGTIIGNGDGVTKDERQ